jgi:murein DD-endopeptidase MepM/ murein hydrolase activator NlpD
MDKHKQLADFVARNPEAIGKIVDFNRETDRLLKFDFTAANGELTSEIIADTVRFTHWVDNKLAEKNYRYGIGGYMEHRTLYGRSELFNNGEEPRRLHLGIDIWAKAGTPVYVPLDGKVHSFRDNNNFGDYGPTIILEHNLNCLTLYSLYGHLSRKDLAGLHEGKPVHKGDQIGAFGDIDENGNWPPHLHFQLMFDMEGMRGDYPGVAPFSQQKKYQVNIPDPNLLLQFHL